jgi:hypothetical protein
MNQLFEKLKEKSGLKGEAIFEEDEDEIADETSKLNSERSLKSRARTPDTTETPREFEYERAKTSRNNMDNRTKSILREIRFKTTAVNRIRLSDFLPDTFEDTRLKGKQFNCGKFKGTREREWEKAIIAKFNKQSNQQQKTNEVTNFIEKQLKRERSQPAMKFGKSKSPKPYAHFLPENKQTLNQYLNSINSSRSVK